MLFVVLACYVVVLCCGGWVCVLVRFGISVCFIVFSTVLVCFGDFGVF